MHKDTDFKNPLAGASALWPSSGTGRGRYSSSRRRTRRGRAGDCPEGLPTPYSTEVRRRTRKPCFPSTRVRSRKSSESNSSLCTTSATSSRRSRKSAFASPWGSSKTTSPRRSTLPKDVRSRTGDSEELPLWGAHGLGGRSGTAEPAHRLPPRREVHEDLEGPRHQGSQQRRSERLPGILGGLRDLLEDPGGRRGYGVRVSGTRVSRARSTRLTRVRQIGGRRQGGIGSPPGPAPNGARTSGAAPGPPWTPRTRTSGPDRPASLAGTAVVPPPGNGGAAVPATVFPAGQTPAQLPSRARRSSVSEPRSGV